MPRPDPSQDTAARPASPRPASHRIAFAFLSTCLAVAIRHALEPALPGQLPYAFFVLAIACTALYGGFIPSLIPFLGGALLGPLMFSSAASSGAVARSVDLTRLALYIPIGLLTGFIADMQRWAGARVDAAMEALREREERLRLALEAGGIGAWDWDIREGRLTWSERLYELHGLAPGSFSGAATDVQRLIHPDDFSRLAGTIRRTFKDAETFQAEFRILRPNGEVRWHVTRGRLHRDEKGQPTRILGATLDITEQKRADQELREVSSRRDELLAMLGHELRNPLAPLRAGAEILRRATGLDPEIARARDIILRQVSHLGHLVDDLVDISRLTTGRFELRRTRLDLVALVRNTAADCQPMFDASNQALILDLPRESIYIQGDDTRLTQCLENVLQNAHKFTPTGGHIRLEVALRQEGEVEIVVRDDGSGMDEQLLARVFEPMAQSERSPDRPLGGLGLGLPLARGIVEGHGGTIRASSDGPGRGSTITITLPRDPDALPLVDNTPVTGAVRPRRLLLIEDNLDAAEGMCMLLELSGHEVSVAHDGRTGLEAIRAKRPEVVLCDIGLPGGMDGYDVARQVRSDPGLDKVHLLALTGYGQEEDQRRAIAAGFTHHLTKPVEPDELERLLASLS